MTYSVVNQMVTSAPAPGHRISFVRMGGTESLDLRDLHERAERLALRMRELGVEPGDRIGILA
ncbi:MAG: AMP-binding protein, partial [Micromonosporaceae bacterium]|nr:AMP-binding protein [Micromonosporaceae bacterium]